MRSRAATAGKPGRRASGPFLREHGIVQAAVIGALVAMIVAVAVSLVTYGPDVASGVARYWRCMLTGQGAGCVGSLPGDPKEPPPPHPRIEDLPAQESVFTIEGTGDCAEAQAMINTLFPGGYWNIDLLNQFSTFSTDNPNVPQPVDGFPAGIEGTVFVNADCEIEFTTSEEFKEPDGDVNTDIDWKKIGYFIAAAVTGAASAVLTWLACTAVFGPGAAAFCGAVSGCVFGFVWTILNAYWNDPDGVDATALVESAAACVIAGAVGAFGKWEPGVGMKVREWAKAIWNGIKNKWNGLWGWIKNTSSHAMDRLSEWWNDLFEHVGEAEGAGVETDAPRPGCDITRSVCGGYPPPSSEPPPPPPSSEPPPPPPDEPEWRCFSTFRGLICQPVPPP